MAELSAPILSVRDLKAYFESSEGTIKAVDGASFDLAPGRTLAVVGESGCGKSVMARSLLRIVDRPGRIVGGEIRLRRPSGETTDLVALTGDGAEIRAVRGREIALIFQEPMASFSMHYTIGNQIVEAIRQHRSVSKADARRDAVELLRIVGIPRPERRVDEYPFQLSGGLRQRVMIAMALASDPSVLIADEPTTALDVTTQAQILDLLRAIQRKRHLALVLITHDMGVVAEMADDVAVMYLGRVVERGPVEAIFNAPRHPYTRALLRSIPDMRAAPGTRLATLQGAIPHPLNRPAGCPFHPRCEAALEGRCGTEMPTLVTEGDGHAVACFLYSSTEGVHA